MSQYARNSRRRFKEIAQDARMATLVGLRTDLEEEYRKVSEFRRLPKLQQRGILVGIHSAIQIVNERIEQHGQDQSPGGREDRPSAGAGSGRTGPGGGAVAHDPRGEDQRDPASGVDEVDH